MFETESVGLAETQLFLRLIILHSLNVFIHKKCTNKAVNIVQTIRNRTEALSLFSSSPITWY